MKYSFPFVICLTLVLCTSEFADFSQSSANDVSTNKAAQTKTYLIGNSLTWDTVPSKLDATVHWHVDCGKSLKYIFEHPEKPCVASSKLWPTALKNEKYDLVSVQPHYGTTLEEDLAVISKWIKLQPQAVFIIHTGWAKSASLMDEFANNDSGGKLNHSAAYFDELLSQLRTKHPQTEFRTTHAMRLLVELKKEIAAGNAPLTSIEDIYRDAIHMTTTAGRYMMHNAMRETFGQPRATQSFPDVPEELRAVLNRLLDERNTWNSAVPTSKEVQ